jgi:hypothetical protein
MKGGFKNLNEFTLIRPLLNRIKLRLAFKCVYDWVKFFIPQIIHSTLNEH